MSIFSFMVLGLSTFAWGGSVGDLELRSDFKVSGKPLITENVTVLDPSEVNPHLCRWIVSRHTELLGLKATQMKDGKFKVRASEISAISEGHLRSSGPWYRPFSEFQCESQPNSWFATELGTRVAVGVAGALWTEILSENKARYEVMLSRVRADRENVALDRAEQAFRLWLRDLEKEWRVRVQQKVRIQEWETYLSEARASGLCGKKNKETRVMKSVHWREMMESVKVQEELNQKIPDVSRLLARAPARLWNGLFSIRVDVGLAGKLLNGRFLIDSSVETSWISPAWLDAQGVYQALAIIPGLPPERVVHRGTVWRRDSNHESGMSLARRARVERTEVSGLDIPLREFLILDSDFFQPPETMTFCCDGVLGRDFLRLFPLEFDSNSPEEVRVWPRENFQWTADTPWLEVRENSAGYLVSSCEVTPMQAKTPSLSKVILPNVGWLLGNEEGMSIPAPWLKEAKKNPTSFWKIQCGDLSFAQEVPQEVSKLEGSALPWGSVTDPAVHIGMPLLSRGPFILDLPHGRIWFRAGLSRKGTEVKYRWPEKLSLEFVLKKGERVLVVKKLGKSPAVEGLIQSGLKPGMEISQVDGIPAEDLDLWDVQRRLAGALGKTVTLQWQTPRGLKIAPYETKHLNHDGKSFKTSSSSK